MHYSNYISSSDARACVKNGARKVSATPTALKQTPKSTLDFLARHGVVVEEIQRSGRPRKLSLEQVKKILAIRQSQLSFYKIADLTGVAKSTAFDYFRRYKNETLAEEEVKQIKLKEAKRVLRQMLAMNLKGELGELAKQGCESKSIEEIEETLRSIHELVRFHASR